MAVEDDNIESSFEDEFNNLVEGENNAELQEEEGQEEEGLLDELAVAEGEDADSEQPDPLAELEAIRAEAQQWKHKYNSDLGRTNALQRQIQERDQRIAELEKKANAAVSPDMDLDSFVKDFPEVAELARRAAEDLYNQRVASLESDLNLQREEATRNLQMQALEQRHPDWRQIAVSNEFRGWVAQQPARIQELVESDAAEDAAYLLDTYKLATTKQTLAPDPQLKQRRDRQLRSAQTVPSRGGRAQSASTPPEDDFDAAFDFYAER